MLAAALFALVLSTSSPAVAAEDVHWQLQMTVDAPAEAGDVFVVNITATLVGRKPGIIVPDTKTVFGVVAIKPDGTRRVVSDDGFFSGEITGGVQGARLWFQPDINGEWSFQLWQYGGPRDILLAEQKVAMDKAFVATATESQFVAAIQTDPVQLVAGQPATITIRMMAAPPASLGEIPVIFVDAEGTHEVGSVPDPGPGQTVSLQWTPVNAANGTLMVFDQSLPVTVLDASQPGSDTTAAPDATDEDAEAP
jgi:hypothetical protein